MEDQYDNHDPAEDLVFGGADPYLLLDEADGDSSGEDLDPSLEGFGDDYFAGQEDDDSLDGDDFDEEVDEDDPDGEFSDEEEDDDEDFDGEDDDPEAGEEDDEELAGPRRRRRVARRDNRQAERQEDRAEALRRRAAANRRKANKNDPPKKKPGKRKAHAAESPTEHRQKVARRKMTPSYLQAKGYSKSPLSGSVKTATKGKDTVTIDVESNFLTESLTMEGSASGAVLYTVWLGELPIWRSTAGTPCSVFAINSLALMGNIGGHLLRPGQKIKLDIETAADNDVVRATFIGWKKTHASVC